MSSPVERLHPGAWWLWGLGIAAAALQTTNVALLAVLAAIAIAVATVCASDGANSSATWAFAKIGLVVIAFRVLLTVLFGSVPGGAVIITLPEADLPDWAAGIRLGGPVTVESMVAAVSQGARLAVAIIAFGAINAVCSPYRMLRVLPAALYELGVAATVALTTAPNALRAARDLSAARRLRGRPTRGLAALRHTAVPVLEGSLDRSVELAASMDVRGFGRSAAIPAGRRRLANLALAVGLASSALALYGLLAAGPSRWIGLAAAAVATGALVWSLHTASSCLLRTRHRPDRWEAPSWAVAAGGLAAAVAVGVCASTAPLVIDPPQRPLALPQLPLWLLATLVGGLAPALLALWSPRPATARPAREV